MKVTHLKRVVAFDTEPRKVYFKALPVLHRLPGWGCGREGRHDILGTALQ